MHRNRIFSLLTMGAALVVTTLAASAATYNVSTSGIDDAARNGTTQPWRTVAYAASRVTTAGNTIAVGSGTFAESTRINLAPGVSLEGAGQNNTVITTSAVYSTGAENTVEYLLHLWSATMTNGNQTISNLTLDGKSRIVRQVCFITRRDNVTIHHVTMKDSYRTNLNASANAITTTWPTMPPATDLMNNLQIYNCTLLNSGQVPANANWGYGTINLWGIRNASIHDNVFDNTTYGGFNIKGEWGDGVTIYNNVLTLPAHWPNSSRGKGFGIELFYQNNLTIHHNQTNGGISGHASNSHIYNNIINMVGEGTTEGIELIGGSNTRIYNNDIRGAGPAGFAAWGYALNDIYIYNNVITQSENGIMISSGQPGYTSPGYAFDGIYIYNNTIDAAVSLYNEGAIAARIQEANGSITDLQIRNNIVMNTTSGSGDAFGVSLTGRNGGGTYAAQMTNVLVSHNIFYNNPNGQVDNQVGATVNNNLTSNPLIQGSGAKPDPWYRLQSASPAVNSGVNVGLPYLGTAPDRGAYEYAPPVTFTRFEAESNYTVAADPGTPSISIGNRNLDSGSSVNIFENGDTIRVTFTVATAGTHTVRVRVRSGDVNNSTNYWPGGYVFKLDGSSTATTFTQDNASVSAYDSSGGGCYWGTMAANLNLSAGTHTLEIAANGSWRMVDYLEVN